MGKAKKSHPATEKTKKIKRTPISMASQRVSAIGGQEKFGVLFIFTAESWRLSPKLPIKNQPSKSFLKSNSKNPDSNSKSSSKKQY